MNLHARHLSSEEETELDELLLDGLELLPIQEQGDEHFVVLAIHMVLEAVRMGEPLPRKMSMEDVSAQLGCVYGEQLCLIHGWEWVYLTIDESYEGVAVANTERNKALFPIPSIHRWSQPIHLNRCLSLLEDIGTDIEHEGFLLLH
jgi:hypothetical protein